MICYDCMLLTCNGVGHMPSMIQIRHVPEDIHRALKIRALKKGLSLSDYLLRELTQIVERPTLDEVLARIESRSDSDIQENTASALRFERESR